MWAYAYEFASDPIVDDATFDRECSLVDLALDTGHPKLDAWFRREFNPSTGMWIVNHPELHKVQALYRRLQQPKET